MTYGDVQSLFGAGGLHTPMPLHVIAVAPWFGHGAAAEHAGEQIEKPEPENRWQVSPVPQLLLAGLHAS